MMKVKKKYLYKLMNKASVIQDEVIVSFLDDSVRVKAVDPSHVAMCDLRLSKEVFDICDIEDEIAVKPDTILHFMKTFDFDTPIEIDRKEDRVLKLSARKEELYTLTSQLWTPDPMSITETNVPELDLPIEFETSNEVLRDLISYESYFSQKDMIRMVFEDGTFTLESEGDTREKVDRMMVENIKILENRCADGDVLTSKFAYDFLRDMSENIHKKKDLNIMLGKDYPVKMSFEFADGHGHGEYLLAPRVESS